MSGAGTLTIARDTCTLSDERADELGLPRGRTWARLAVEDTGCGIDEAVRERIFDPFFTTKPQGKGTGLGLSVVYGVVRAHDGAIHVTSAPGATRFEIVLPTVEPVAPIAQPSPPPPVHASRDHRGHVLVVDDEPMVRKATCRILKRHGLATCEAENGRQALDAFEAEPDRFALVVLDMAMPVMGGAECFRRLRERSSVPILIVSGYALAADTRALLATGRSAFVEKPFAAAQLMAHIDALVGADQASSASSRISSASDHA
jgi:two-component system cell cycle sensor histidine kinase/response regulator CckA